MAADDLSKPLTPDHPVKGARNRWSWVNFAAAALIIVGLGVLAWIPLQHNPLGGQPYVIVSLQTDPETQVTQASDAVRPIEIRQTIAPSDADQPDRQNETAPPNVTSVQQGGDIAINQDPTRQSNGSAHTNQPAIYRADGNGQIRLSSAADQNLIEQTRAGSLPKIGPQGQRASVVYARPSGIGLNNTDDPKIAILVTGLGISASGTSEAIQRLPGAVTLAFAPYGTDLQRWIGKARRAGHEVMLQIPMEPFDYPDNDPGPHTLLTSVDGNENLKRMRWLMSRFTGYVGITNYMGARLTAKRDVFEPILREMSERGLLYLDDGSSPRSVHKQIAASISLQARSADTMIDAQQNDDSIEQALQHLETLSYQQGIAVGVASALPLSIEKITEWAAGLREKGITLIPVSASYSRPEQS